LQAVFLFALFLIFKHRFFHRFAFSILLKFNFSPFQENLKIMHLASKHLKIVHLALKQRIFTQIFAFLASNYTNSAPNIKSVHLSENIILSNTKHIIYNYIDWNVMHSKN